MFLDTIYNQDCLEGMKNIPDGSVDLILTDPPYNIRKAKWDKWKSVDEYVNWCGSWILECERVLKDNGSFYFFHNDIEQIARLMEWIRENTKFVFNSFIIWDKENFRALSWKNPSEKNNLRSWFNTCEYCLFYTFQDETGLGKVLMNPAFYGLQNYFREQRKIVGMSLKQLDEIMGIKASYSYWEKPTTHPYRIPTEENYKSLQNYFGDRAFRREYEDLRREYEDLRREYEDLRFVHNLDSNHNNVWKSGERNSGKLHPTQKPIDILTRIISTSSNENFTVLDPFMGSGSTAVACVNTGRNYIGFETDFNYCKIASRRVLQARLKKYDTERRNFKIYQGKSTE